MFEREYVALFDLVEEAVHKHPKLECDEEWPGTSITISRIGTIGDEQIGCKAEIRVKNFGSRKKPTAIHASGATPEEAVKELIKALDVWSQAIQ